MLRAAWAAVLAAACVLAAESGAQPLDRKAIGARRNAMIDWAIRNGVILKGMTKTEVHKIYGFPDKKFNTATTGGRVEKWTYYHPRRRSIFPFTRSPFASRYRFLYFKDDVLVNFEP
jgi:hypothetical protein